MPTLTTLVDGTVPVAADFNGNYQALNNVVGSLTSISAWATGEMPYASAANTWSRLSPGSNGQVLTMGASVPGWQGGAWTTPAYSAGDYTANGAMTWTVGSGDVTTFKYIVLGKTMTISFLLNTTTIGGTPNSELRIAIPASKLPSASFDTAFGFYDNGTTGTGILRAGTGNAYLSLFKNLAAPNLTASTDNTDLSGQITFETQ